MKVTSKKIQYVIDKLKSVEHLASKDGALEMGAAYVVNRSIHCGTVHCHAGWYAVANKRRKSIKERINNGFCDFEDGVDLMTKDLGLGNEIGLRPLESWASLNSEIWGNDYGRRMFRSKEAFNYPGFSGIIRHWEGVRDRTIEIEAIELTNRKETRE